MHTYIQFRSLSFCPPKRTPGDITTTRLLACLSFRDERYHYPSSRSGNECFVECEDALSVSRLAHGALVHGVGEDLAALREEDTGGFRGGAVGD